MRNPYIESNVVYLILLIPFISNAPLFIARLKSIQTINADVKNLTSKVRTQKSNSHIATEVYTIHKRPITARRMGKKTSKNAFYECQTVAFIKLMKKATSEWHLNDFSKKNFFLKYVFLSRVKLFYAGMIMNAILISKII